MRSEEIIVVRLKGHADSLRRKGDPELADLLQDAADMLDLVFNVMQADSWRMDGQAKWRFTSGWPLSAVRAHSPEMAIRYAMLEVNRSRQEMAEKKNGQADS